MFFTTNVSNDKWYQGAWQLLYSSNYDKVYKIALSIVIDREIAKDVTQEVFVSAFLKINTLKEMDKFSSWICTIAENTGKNMLKKKIKHNNRNVHLEDEDKNIPDNIIRFCDSNNPEQIYELKEDSKEVLHYIEELGLEEQRILSLKYYDGFSYTQIAEQMNLKELNR